MNQKLSFHKAGKIKDRKFILRNEELKKTDSSTYLGVERSISGFSKLADQAPHKTEHYAHGLS